VQGNFCYILSLPFTITGIHFDCDRLVISGLQGNFSSKFFLGISFQNLDPAEWAYSQFPCTGVLMWELFISQLCTSCLQCHEIFLSLVEAPNINTIHSWDGYILRVFCVPVSNHFRYVLLPSPNYFLQLPWRILAVGQFGTNKEWWI